ncbi:MAG TPA: hypothetical protein PLD20_05675 [Blastocatellia bacterium]|nr:hypothetical protein [Blastocatellia bacterium]HMX25677.1 hypothetical protein [Blastocatellia bacterium]HMZ17396.1 hypothetical protein [Blastocatellia bacterium]HNG29232.1 hypothetical protein [Blastocatellia bacterium]
MEEQRAKNLNIILAVLDTDKQQLADEIGEDRTVVTKVLAGKRKAPATRKKLAGVLCKKIEALLISDSTPQQAEGKVA